MNRTLLGILKRKNPINTNILTANQTLCGRATGDTTGYLATGANSPTLISNWANTGLNAIQLITPNAVGGEMLYQTSNPCQAGEQYTMTAVVTGNGTVFPRLSDRTGADALISNEDGSNISLSSTPQIVSLSRTTTASTGVRISGRFVTPTQQEATIQVGHWVIRKGTY